MGEPMAKSKKHIIFPSNNRFGGGASTKDRKAARLAARRGVTQRVIRVATGWRIEETRDGIRRRSPDLWRTHDAATLAMDDGYQMPSLPPAQIVSVMLVDDIVPYQICKTRCFLCNMVGEEKPARFSLRVRMDGRKTACFSICSGDFHDLAIGDRINDKFEKKELGQ